MLVYAEYGDPDGIAVLGLHGTPGTRHIFSLADASARKHGLRLIAPDRAGIGGSEDCSEHSIAGHAEDSVTLIDHLGAEKFGVLGFSGGGPYTAEVARQAGNRIQAMALVSAHVLGLPPGPAHYALMRLADASIPVSRSLFVAIACAAVGVPFFSRLLISPGLNRSDRRIMADREVRRCLTKGIGGALWGGRATAYEARNFYREHPHSPIALDAPVRIWHGTEDKIIKPEAARRYSHMFSGSFLNIIPGAGHLWGLVAHDEVLEALAADIASKPPDPL